MVRTFLEGIQVSSPWDWIISCAEETNLDYLSKLYKLDFHVQNDTLDVYIYIYHSILYNKRYPREKKWKKNVQRVNILILLLGGSSSHRGWIICVVASQLSQHKHKREIFSYTTLRSIILLHFFFLKFLFIIQDFIDNSHTYFLHGIAKVSFDEEI